MGGQVKKVRGFARREARELHRATNELVATGKSEVKAKGQAKGWFKGNPNRAAVLVKTGASNMLIQRADVLEAPKAKPVKKRRVRLNRKGAIPKDIFASRYGSVKSTSRLEALGYSDAQIHDIRHGGKNSYFVQPAA